MAIFPKVQSPCPYKADLAAVMEGDFCRMCRRQVVDLSPMSDGQRLTFLAGCKEQVCVSYRFPVGPAIAAAVAAAAMGAPIAASAQEATQEIYELVVGGIMEPSKVELVATPDDAATPELPVVYDDGTPATPANAAPAKP